MALILYGFLGNYKGLPAVSYQKYGPKMFAAIRTTLIILCGMLIRNETGLGSIPNPHPFQMCLW